MTRGKQKKNGSPFVNNLTKEDGRRGVKGGKRGEKVSIQIYDEDDTRDSKLAGGLVTSGGRKGKKRGESFQLKYSKRYDELLYLEPMHTQKSEVSNSIPSGPPSSAKGTRKHRTGPHDVSSHGLEIVNDEPLHRKNSGARKNRKMRKSGTQTYNTTVYNYASEEARRKTDTTDEVHSSDMDATPEVVLPGTESRAEVVVDRRGVGNCVASYSPAEGYTWGLRYVKRDISEKSSEEIFNETPASQKVDGRAVLDLNRAQMDDGKVVELGQRSKTRKGRHTFGAKEFAHSRRNKAKQDQSSRGFLSVGGLKIYTEDVSDTSDDKDSCTDQMEEGFTDEDDGYMGLSRSFGRREMRIKGKIGRRKHLRGPDRTRFSAITLDSSDEDDSNETSDSDISIELVDDYLANCEGLSADIDDRSWVSRNQKSLQYPHIDEMDIIDEESESSEEIDVDPESHDVGDSGSELEDDLKHRYRITAGVFGRQVHRRGPSKEKAVQGVSDAETEDLEQTAFFGYDSDSSSTGEEEDKEGALLSDDEVRIRDLELDDEARILDLELQDNLVAPASVNTETAGGLVPASVNTVTVRGLVSSSVNTDTTETLVSTSVNTETTGGLFSVSSRDVLVTSSVATQTLPVSPGEALIREPGLLDKKGRPARVNMAPKYRSVSPFVSGLAEEVLLSCPVPAQTWPVSTCKAVKKSKGVPGQKKVERQESIAEKRRERAVKRGFDIAAVNEELEKMVRLKKDIIAFEPMDQRDRAQIRRLAGMYKLKSGSQGTTKRRFVVVSITKDTCMPSAEDKVRLLRLLGQGKSQVLENTPTSSRPLTGEDQRKLSKMKRAARQALQGLEIPVSKKRSKFRYFSSSAVKTPNTNSRRRSAEKPRDREGNPMASGLGSRMKRSEKKSAKTAVVYANNPVSFVGRGIEDEDACIALASTLSSTPGSGMERIRLRSSKADAGFSGASGLRSRSTEFAGFEAHTSGFASRMMAKMGYVEGHGLGRDKQGIAQPMEAVIRPKSLGLGAHT